MSRLIMWNLLTFDGFFEGAKSWQLDWHRHALCEDFEHYAIEQPRSAERILFGRVTYEGMAAYWPAAHGERNIFVFGSANLSVPLMSANLFDEYRLAITPVVLGKGGPLFPEGTDRLNLKLLESRQLSSGCVILRYGPETNP